ncbi:MAG: efflux transporter periplasmic adaptor subunit [Pseudomonadota bacterium]
MIARLLRLGAQGVLPALVLITAFAITSALLSGPSRQNAQRERTETVYSVTAVDAALATNRATLRAFGEVVAATSADLRVASPGTVIAVHDTLQVGRTVEAGTKLVTIDPFTYEGALRDARAQLAEARARKTEADARIAMEGAMAKSAAEQLTFAQTDLDRAERLSRSGAITERALDDRRLLVSQRQQTLDQRRFTLEAEEARRAQQAAAIDRLEWAVEKAERALADTVLTAPFTGVVRAENAAIGRLLAANDIAVSLIRADALDVRFVLSDQRYGRLLAGNALFETPVDVIWRIGDQPIRYTATITRAGADIEAGRAGVDVFARLALDGRPTPRPGAFVEVLVPGLAHEETARIPTAALYDGSVFVIGADERLVAKPITLVAIDDAEAIVRGVAEGDAVVTTRLAEAGVGVKVRRVDPFASPGATDPNTIADAERDAPPRRARGASRDAT